MWPYFGRNQNAMVPSRAEGMDHGAECHYANVPKAERFFGGFIERDQVEISLLQPLLSHKAISLSRPLKRGTRWVRTSSKMGHALSRKRPQAPTLTRAKHTHTNTNPRAATLTSIASPHALISPELKFPSFNFFFFVAFLLEINISSPFYHLCCFWLLIVTFLFHL